MDDFNQFLGLIVVIRTIEHTYIGTYIGPCAGAANRQHLGLRNAKSRFNHPDADWIPASFIAVPVASLIDVQDATTFDAQPRTIFNT